MGGVKWNISCHQKTKMPHLPTMPVSQNVNISPTSKQQTREVPTICHTKNLSNTMNLRMPQSFTGGQGQLISLRQTTVYVYNNKISNIRVKVTEQIHCEFQINPSGYIRTLITSWDTPSWPILIPVTSQRAPLKTTFHQGLGFQHLCWSEGNKYSGRSVGWEFPRTKPRHRFPNGKHLLMNKLNFENHFKGLIMWWNIKNCIKNKNKIIKTTRSKTPEISLCPQRSLESKLWIFQ